RKESEKILKKAGISIEDLKVVGELKTTESVLTAVSEGLGISLISSIAAFKLEKMGSISCLRLPDTIPSKRKLYLVKRRVEKGNEKKILEAFWNFMKNSCG
ncbi:MAG: LysR substrate-binding domain-containing protein, partial [Candidatus Helarchaeales archaeon]